MQKSKYMLIAAVALALVCSAYLLSLGIRHFRGGDPTVRVTGMSEKSITSDLAVLTISFNQQGANQQEVYAKLQGHKKQVMAYLTKAGFTATELEAGSTRIIKGYGELAAEKNGTYYFDRDRYFTGYRLSESITIRSNKVDQVENVSASISQLISEGVEVETSAISYYYTKLNDLKIEMLKEASVDARSRATIIAESSMSTLGDLKGATMGVFQVVGRNQAEEEYSWGGTLNTSQKEKTATVTVKANYILK